MKIRLAVIISICVFFADIVSNVQAQCQDLKELSKRVSPAIVFLKADYACLDQRIEPTFATGTGFFIESSGTILTTDHLVASRLVRQAGFGMAPLIYKLVAVSVFYQNKQYSARVVGVDEYKKVGIIKLVQTGAKINFPVVKFGDTSRLRQGDCLFTIANAFNIKNALKYGIVASIESTFGDGVKYLISHEGIAEGDSGGPVFDQKGEVVAINTFTIGTTIAALVLLDDFVKKSIDALKNESVIDRPRFPGSLGDLSMLNEQTSLKLQAEIRSKYKLPLDIKRGLLVRRSTQPEFLEGDVLLELDYWPISDINGFFRMLDNTLPRQKLTFTLLRDGKLFEVSTAISAERIIPNPS